MSQLHIVALGSSFAAGPGIDPVVDKLAGRSGRNYANILAIKLNAKLNDLTVSGATLSNIIDTPQSLFMSTYPPQLLSLSSSADIVTITAGGNDLGYVKGMLLDSLLASAPYPLSAMWAWCYGDGHPMPGPEKVMESLIALVDRIRLAAPRATIFLVEYLAVFSNSSSTGRDTQLSSRQIQHYRNLAHVLHEAYRRTEIARLHVVRVPMHSLSQAHALGSSEPWIKGFSASMLLRGEIPYHPNADGHEAVAQQLLERVEASIKKHAPIQC